ncbi:excalibur calcium-binding domain-containing protein [Aggregatibacter aphrophilus]|uniref:excalibur calcium-binding domain-containing protein n=1 Tax=Aggregatibacter aphrophilus TaxID=732 RepID=UPI0028EA033B|nr:excalibur calcium-binding domain-containing protein [Aggregatibacter aphrophilus]
MVQYAAVKSNNNYGEFTCDEQKDCKEMSSCTEAKYHLNICGEGRLDRDKGGIPCKKPC